ncbi:type II toxin-antitoxin system RelE/ParE family toxin [Acetobacter aceti]|uniref:type II toxin-antitoxin system RelE/ParE family toxin n=1 Tax=Acetobacter aceti TaxID=435 RepID=UPI000369E749|nr:type II toxin-antitoxin system RelE/ParE family toxin [Acetobacter aceti]
MFPVVWRDTARADLRQIITDIAAENPGAARRLKIRLETVVLPLSEHPYRLLCLLLGTSVCS